MAIKASNQITITDITDAYSVFMDNDTYSFMATNSYGITGSCVTNITAICGTEDCTVSVTQANIKFYEQGSNTEMQSPPVTATVTPGTGNLSTTITFTAVSNATLTTPVEAVIPISVDNSVEVTKRFTLSATPKGDTGQGGAAGKGITSVTRYFQRTNTSTAPSRNATGSPGSSWSTTMTAPDASNHYLWATDHYEYTDSTTANSTVILASQYNDANKWYSGTAITGTSTTATIFSGSGITNAVVGDQYLNTSTGNTYKCTVAGAASVAKWVYTGNIKGTPGTNGTNGTNGADAILLEISASGPTVFKKNTDNVTLSPVVRVAGSSLTITAASGGATVSIGGTTHYVRWFYGSTELTKANTANSVVAVKSGSNYTGSLQIYGAYVTNAALIECRLDTTAAS